MLDKLKRLKLSFWSSLAFKIPFLFIAMLLFMMGTFLMVMEYYGRPLLLNIAKQQVRQSGESIVAVLGERLALTSSLVTSMANTAEALPPNNALHHKVIRRLVDYEGTEHFIAGGGIWPEPFLYNAKVERHSFFWGRGSTNQLEFFDDYNQKDSNGYHHEEWYVPGRYLAPGKVYWSRSYMDPYSFQSMVTATAPMYHNKQFYGVATVDIKLEGLTQLLEREAKKFGGYAYALDRNGTFLSFPDESLSQRITYDDQNNLIKEYLNIAAVSEKNKNIPNFSKTLNKLENISLLNKHLVKKAENIARNSYQIDLAEAHRIVSIIADPFRHKSLGDTFLQEQEMQGDPILDEPVLINAFHVPNTYWKIITVTPKRVVHGSTDQIEMAVLTGFMYVIIVGLLIGLLMIYRVLIQPLQSMRQQVQDKMGEHGLITGITQGELGELSAQFNLHTQELNDANHHLSQLVVDAEQAAKAKTQFLANMSHEIRTPMNGVLGMLNLLLRGEMNRQQQHYVQVAKSSADSLLVLINDILDFSKIEAGKLDLEIIEFDLRSLLSEFATTMAHLVQNKGLELILDVNAVQHRWVKGDPGRIRQIFTNLVSNAIKFTDEGEVVIRVGLKDAEGMGLVMYASVADTGIGIARGKQNILFDSFSQVDASTTRQYGGTGLGLAICKQLCELMGGSISVRSEIAEGSRFEFTITLEKSERTVLGLPKVDLKNKRILIVDDNQTNRLVLSDLLMSWGALVVEAIGGRETLQLLNLAPEYDAIILDMQMPFMDGAQLGRRIRAQKKWDNIALIMMTSKSERGDAKYFSSLGFAAYLPKPVTPADIHDSLQIAIEGGELLEQASPLITHHHLETLRGLDSQQKNALSSHPARILLVEDNLINQEVAMAVLEDLGFSADVVTDGLQALKALENAADEFSYDLILMDCQMPVMDGYEATAEIRNGNRKIHDRNIPIIAMTANAMKGDKDKCLAAGMSDYISKPIDVTILEDKLKKWLEV